jgi:hypothetical protein
VITSSIRNPVTRRRKSSP